MGNGRKDGKENGDGSMMRAGYLEAAEGMGIGWARGGGKGWNEVKCVVELFGRQKPVYRFCANFLRRQKSVYRQHGMLMPVPEVGIQTLFSNAYWHRNARVRYTDKTAAEKYVFFHEQILHLDT